MSLHSLGEAESDSGGEFKEAECCRMEPIAESDWDDVVWCVMGREERDCKDELFYNDQT